MDDMMTPQGWVPAQRSIRHRRDPETEIGADPEFPSSADAGAAAGGEAFFLPTILPEGSGLTPPVVDDWDSTPSPASFFDQPPDGRREPAPALGSPRSPGPVGSARSARSGRSGSPGGPGGPGSRTTLLRFVSPSQWQPPARLGSGPVRTLRLLLGRHRQPLAIGLALAALWITLRSALPSPPATVAVLVAARDLPAGRTLTAADLRPVHRPVDQVPGGRLNAATGRTLAAPIRAGEPITDARVVGPGLLTGQVTGTVAMPVRLGDPAAGALVHAGDRVDILASSSSTAAAWSSEPDLVDGTGPSTNPDTGTSPDGTGVRRTDSPLGAATTRSGTGAERVATRALVLAAPGAASTEDGSGIGAGGLGNLTGGAWSGTGSGPSSTAGLLVLAVSPDEAGRLAAVQSGASLTIAVLPQPQPQP
jgi:Flp pilus assembly protein CpaB